jgi:hypothetical protein
MKKYIFDAVLAITINMGKSKIKSYGFDPLSFVILIGCLFLVGWGGLKLAGKLSLGRKLSGWEVTTAAPDYIRLVKVVLHSGEQRRKVLYKPEISYVYSVDGIRYRASRFMLVDRAFSSEKKAWAFLDEKFAIQEPCALADCPSIEAYYNPKRPQQAILVREYSLFRIVAIYSVFIVGYGFFALGCVLALRKPIKS